MSILQNCFSIWHQSQPGFPLYFRCAPVLCHSKSCMDHKFSQCCVVIVMEWKCSNHHHCHISPLVRGERTCDIPFTLLSGLRLWLLLLHIITVNQPHTHTQGGRRRTTFTWPISDDTRYGFRERFMIILVWETFLDTILFFSVRRGPLRVH